MIGDLNILLFVLFIYLLILGVNDAEPGWSFDGGNGNARRFDGGFLGEIRRRKSHDR